VPEPKVWPSIVVVALSCVPVGGGGGAGTGMIEPRSIVTVPPMEKN